MEIDGPGRSLIRYISEIVQDHIRTAQIRVTIVIQIGCTRLRPCSNLPSQVERFV